MSLEFRKVSEEKLRSLQSCLVEGDPEERKREQRVRRRALAISVATQSLAVAAIVLIPLFGKPARIALANVVPLPPYYGHSEARPGDPARPHIQPSHKLCRFCAPKTISPTIPTRDEPVREEVGDPIPGVLEGPQVPGAVPLDSHEGLRPTPPPQTQPQTQRVVHLTQIDPATLTHRVEPAYPTLMRQTGRSGKVELRAIIATDGTIESLQIVGGDPGFYQSAMEAVRQWRYKPTVLNGQPVAVDTFITVIYNIQR
jgi:periplasmic protein TonB